MMALKTIIFSRSDLVNRKKGSIRGLIEMSSNFLIVFVILLCVFQLSHSSEDVGAASAAADIDENLSARSNSDDTLEIDLSENSQKPEGSTLTTTEESEVTFEKLYAEGVKAYDQHLWYACANKIEKAVQDYKKYKKVLSNCRLDCSKGIRKSKLSNLSSSIEDFEILGKFLRNADCFRRCKDESLSTHPRVSEKLEHAFEKRVPYQYLQFCYFKLDRLTQAASASYTFFLANPGDTDSRQNIMYYRDKALVPDTDFVDMELVPYKEHYIRAMMAYTEENWKGVIRQVEACLVEYYNEVERCYSACEASVKMKGAEFTTGVADVIISILVCKLDCEEKISVVYSEPIDNFHQDMYHYLQFAYYKEGDLEKSAEATASFLALNSSHAVMKDNKEVLKTKLGYSNDDFIPRKEVAEYATTKKEMQDLMDFINKNYRWPDDNEEIPDEDVHEVLERMEKEAEEAGEYVEDWMSRYEQLGMHIIAKSVDLEREERFVTDGLLKGEQCEELLTLAKDLKTSPYGSQKFDLKVAQQRLEENPEEEFEASLRLFVRAAEVVRHYVQRYLQPDDSFYLQYTSIVCWAKPDGTEGPPDCYPQEDGSCIKFEDMSDELYSDAYTTVTYLNTVDEDGDFQFLSENKAVDSSFGVKCGRTVGFNTGDRHTLKIPNKDSQRCAMVIRYTTYRSDDEKDYRDTIALLHRVDELRLANSLRNGEEVMKAFEEKGVKVVKKADDLKGKERFVADGLASDAQCSTLRNMVLELGKAGDGYSGKSSPHTVNEMFAGLTLDHMCQLAHQGMVSTAGLRALLELSESSRLFVERYFNLTKPLHFDYTHLVCRTAIDDTKNNRQDLSHPVHADNCNLKPDGSCDKSYPAFTQRDYSAILYLNADFEGGEFFFAHSNKSEQVSIRPKCGRLVGFNAGNFHGVRAVKSGQRCALALWFTHNPNFKELAHIQARKTLKQLEEDQRNEENNSRDEL